MDNQMWDPLLGQRMAQRTTNHPNEFATDPHLTDVKLEHLSLICRALWSILAEKTGVTEGELLDRVKQLDMLDGKMDNKLAVGPVICPGCQRLTSSRAKNCLYCGEAIPEGNPFDRV